MYTLNTSDFHAEFWFDDYDEWVNVKDQIEDAINEGHHGWAFSVDYEGMGGEPYPERGRCCIFVMELQDLDRVQGIVQRECEEWAAWLLEETKG